MSRDSLFRWNVTVALCAVAIPFADSGSASAAPYLSIPSAQKAFATLVLGGTCPVGDDSLDADGDGVPDACDLCEGADDSQDIDGDTIPDACDLCNNNLPGDCTLASPILAGPPHDIRKIRFISIQPLGPGGFNTGQDFDIQVRLSGTLVSGVPLDLPHWWAGPPITDFTGAPEPNGVECISYLTATRPAAPINWDDCALLHITGCQIIPTSAYDVAIMSGNFMVGPPLATATQAKPDQGKWWGDTVGHYDGTKWTAPQGVVNIDDAMAGIRTFMDPTALPGCPFPPCLATHVSVNNISYHGDPATPFGTPNLCACISDVFGVLLGFQGIEYPGYRLDLCPD